MDDPHTLYDDEHGEGEAGHARAADDDGQHDLVGEGADERHEWVEIMA